MKKGFTTGTASAAAAKAHATYLLSGKAPSDVAVLLPSGEELTVKVHSCSAEMASVIKDAGDDPDITHGALICAKVTPDKSGDIRITGGKGIGIVTKSGLQIEVGKPAINPAPQKMIRANLINAGVTSCTVEISVPDGEALAEQTFNSRIGIIGGISIIGTTGIVEPMSIEALTATIACEIDVQTENGAEEIFLVPGKIGEKHLQKMQPDAQAVIMSNYAGFAIEHAVKKGVKKITLAGHPGKLAKIAMGYYDTHSKNSPMAQNYLKQLLGLDGEFNTAEEVCQAANLSPAAEAVSRKVKSDYPLESVSVILFSMCGDLVGEYYG